MSPTPLSLSVHEDNKITPTFGETTRQTPTGQPSQFGASAPRLQVAPVAPVAPSARGQLRPVANTRLLLVCLICVGVLLLGLGAVIAAPRLFSSPASSTPAVHTEVAGQIRFLSSTPGSPGTFNAVQIDLNNVQPAPAGQVYYAWLTQENSEALAVPHWPLQASNGALHDRYTSSSAQTNLLSGSKLFLITGEDASGTPVVPYPSPARHYYYALITPTTASAPTFEVKKCPTSNVNSTSNPCL